MEPEPLDRARQRLAVSRRESADATDLESALERAQTALESFAERTAELEAAVPERVGTAVREGLRAEALPVARQIAEVRGLSGQAIRRLERLQGDVDAERKARVEDLAVLVDLVASGWHAVERRLDRLERVVDRLERSLADRPPATLYRVDERGRAPGA